MERIEEPFAELSANIYSIENKLQDVQRMMLNRNDDLRAFIREEIERSTLFLKVGKT